MYWTFVRPLELLGVFWDVKIGALLLGVCFVCVFVVVFVCVCVLGGKGGRFLGCPDRCDALVVLLSCFCVCVCEREREIEMGQSRSVRCCLTFVLFCVYVCMCV
jgi:hypothetical protein